jgi:hypothetical protein
MVQRVEKKAYGEFGQIRLTKIDIKGKRRKGTQRDGRIKEILALGICLMFVEVGSISAQTDTSVLLKRHTFEVAPEISYITYSEPNMKEKGMMYSLAASYTYHNRIMLKVEGRGGYGRVDYDGTTLAGTTVTENNNPNYIWEVRGLGGYDLPISKSSILTPHIGIGCRYLNNDVLPKPYERESTYIYSPIGISFITGLENGWSIGGTGEYDYFWWGKQTSHPMDELPGLLSDIESHPNNGYGLRASITLEKKYKKVIFEGGPFIRYWNIEKSKTETLPYVGVPTGLVWQEPGNDSTEIGIKLSVKF